MTSVGSENSALSITMQGNKMLQPEEVAAMVQLHGLGWGAKRLSKEFGCSRNTVRRYLRAGGPVAYRKPERRRSLDGLEDWLRERWHGKWEEHQLEARQKRALERLGDEDANNLAPEDDAYVMITELVVREPKQSPLHYTLKFRPATFATLPSPLTWEYVEAPSMPGIINRTDLPISRHRYGVIKTNRPFTEDGCAAYDIIRA